MTRRAVLLGVGGLASLGLIGTVRPCHDPRSIRLWASERASTYPAVLELAADLVSVALDAAGVAATVTIDETPVALASDDDERSRRVTWPRLVLGGALGVGRIDPVRDVNLLVTDGDATGPTAGYAIPRIAALAGARHLVDLPPADRRRPVIEHTVPAMIAQLLLHECGHALGLEHDHGTISHDGGTAIVSPMVSGYAWATASVRRRQLPGSANACGEPLQPVTDQVRRLSLRYSDCAATALRQHCRGRRP